MKSPHTMTDTDRARWLDKTAASIRSAVCRGNRRRVCDLAVRYDDLRDAMSFDAWREYCDARGYAINHRGHDCAA